MNGFDYRQKMSECTPNVEQRGTEKIKDTERQSHEGGYIEVERYLTWVGSDKSKQEMTERCFLGGQIRRW